MNAIVMQEFGGPEVLRIGTVDTPDTAPGWVEVDLRASALNWHDILVRQGRYGSPLPHVPGADGAGVRRDTGEKVLIIPSLWWGDREAAPGAKWEILGDHRHGTYADVVSVPEGCVVPAPDGWSFEQAAALPLVGLTTFRALFTRGRLQAGESVLILGAGGGVATMAITLASSIGAVVVVTSSSEDKIEQSRSLGASGGVLYTDPDWPTLARESSPGGEGFDVVIDSVGLWPDSIAAARPGGRIVVFGASRAESATVDVRDFYFGQYELIGTTMGSPGDFGGLLDLLKEHRVAPPEIGKVFPLDRAADAHTYLEQGSGFGKVVLSHN